MHENNNTKLSKAALLLVQNILEELVAQEYKFLENEPRLLLEFLLRKLPHNIVTISEAAIENLYLFQKLYPI